MQMTSISKQHTLSHCQIVNCSQRNEARLLLFLRTFANYFTSPNSQQLLPLFHENILELLKNYKNLHSSQPVHHPTVEFSYIPELYYLYHFCCDGTFNTSPVTRLTSTLFFYHKLHILKSLTLYWDTPLFFFLLLNLLTNCKSTDFKQVPY